MNTRLCFLAASVLSTTVGSAQSLVNGSFESSVPSNGSGNGWTSSNIDASGGWQATGGLPNGHFILNESADPTTNPTISQLITDLTPGAEYQLTGDFTNIYESFGSPESFTFGVAIDGTLRFQGKKGTEGVWQNFTFNFFPADGEALLEIMGEMGDDVSYRVDNLSIKAVPEPATMGALALGSMVLLRRRRKR